MKTHAEKIKEIIKSEFAHSISYSNMNNVKNIINMVNYEATDEIIKETINLFKNSFDFVDKLYPSANIKQANIYIVSPYLLSEYGYNGIGGFYDLSSRVIIISSYLINDKSMEFTIKGQYTLDEILCHELIHYASMAVSPVSSRYLEEEIAYGKSSIYLSEKGHDVDWIIRNNMMPYLINIANKDNVEKLFLRKMNPTNMKICKETVGLLIKDNYNVWMNILLEEAYKIGMSIIKKYLPANFVEGNVEKPDKIDNIEINIDDLL